MAYVRSCASDSGGGISTDADLLWENPNPRNSFTAKTITGLPLEQYDVLMVKYVYLTNDWRTTNVYYPIVNEMQNSYDSYNTNIAVYWMLSETDNSREPYEPHRSMTNNGIDTVSWGGGYGYAGGTQDNGMIPYKLYGIKFQKNLFKHNFDVNPIAYTIQTTAPGKASNTQIPALSGNYSYNSDLFEPIENYTKLQVKKYQAFYCISRAYYGNIQLRKNGTIVDSSEEYSFKVEPGDILELITSNESSGALPRNLMLQAIEDDLNDTETKFDESVNDCALHCNWKLIAPNGTADVPIYKFNTNLFEVVSRNAGYKTRIKSIKVKKPFKGQWSWTNGGYGTPTMYVNGSEVPINTTIEFIEGDIINFTASYPGNYRSVHILLKIVED